MERRQERLDRTNRTTRFCRWRASHVLVTLLGVFCAGNFFVLRRAERALSSSQRRILHGNCPVHDAIATAGQGKLLNITVAEDTSSISSSNNISNKSSRDVLMSTAASSKEALTQQLKDDLSQDQHNDVNKTSAQAAEQASAPLSIFYNIYLPTDRMYQHDIVEEQMEQIGTAFRESLSSVTVRYVSIGSSIDQLMADNCQKLDLKCQKIAHYSEGFETKTLDKLWDYCQADPSESVAYIHNKGSFHPLSRDKVGYVINQHSWRRAGTKAALSPECAKGLEQGFDFCGLIVAPMHSPGNFWTARCSYINQLMQPLEYQRAFADYVENIAEPYLENNTMNLLFQRGGRRFRPTLGNGRHTDETWIGSHPSAKPCDVSSESSIRSWQTETNHNSFNLSQAPRHDLKHMIQVASTPIPLYVLNREHFRIRDYNLLGGMITRWLYFYNQTPPPTSWFWSYYPDAKKWQEAVAKYGALAFEKVAATVPAIGYKAA